jgi:hypothetical protein
MNQVPRVRIRRANTASVRTDGNYVLYWMIANRTYASSKRPRLFHKSTGNTNPVLLLSFPYTPRLLSMAAYSRFLGGAVKVEYRQGDIFLSASGTFVADSGRSIFLEQHLEQRGKRNYFRWEIPYPYIHRIEVLIQPSQEETPAMDSPGSLARAAAASASARSAVSSSDVVNPFRPRRGL